MDGGLERRTFLRLLAAGGAAASWPTLGGCHGYHGLVSQGPAHFLSPAERRTLEALAAAVLPEGGPVGALGADAVEYIDRFLAAFDEPVPSIYRGGPFSGRHPYPDPRTGEPSGRFPENGFAQILPPTRLQEATFRILLYGSDAAPGALHDPGSEPWPGLRALYRGGLADLRQRTREAGADELSALDPAVRLELFDRGEGAFRNAVLGHLVEGMFCPPEYGGNRDGIAWRDYHYDGDSQPLGSTLYNRDEETLRDRADRPNQTLDPRLPNDGFSPAVLARLDAMVRGLGGRRYF